jgi:copper homeostasis protein
MLEICVDCVESALAAGSGGADRIELCAALPEGGTTPSLGMIERVREAFSGRLMVIIRPRGHDFLFDADELAVMRSDILHSHRAGADGVVIGCLRADGTVDRETCARLLDAADGMDVTFHRAIDMTRDPIEALDDVMSFGIRRILTSGAAATAGEGKEMIRRMVLRAGSDAVIMPGGGLGSGNLAAILHATGASEAHLSARRDVAGKMTHRNPDVFMGNFTRGIEYDRRVTCADEVRRCAEILRDLRNM